MNINIKAIIYGWLTNLITSAGMGFILGIILGVIETIYFDYEVFQSTGNMMLVSSLIIGGVAAILGGYVAARVAKINEMKHSFLSSLLMLLTISVVSYFSIALFPTWFFVMSLIIIIPLALLGGYLRIKSLNKNNG